MGVWDCRWNENRAKRLEFGSLTQRNKLKNTPVWGYGLLAQGKRSATLGDSSYKFAPLKGVRAKTKLVREYYMIQTFHQQFARTPFRGANFGVNLPRVALRLPWATSQYPHSGV
jgi:hypothetical protein